MDMENEKHYSQDSKMNICIAASYFMPYIRSNDYEIAQALCELGHSVTIRTSRSRTPREKIITAGASYPLDFEVNYIPSIMGLVENPVVASLDIKGFDLVLLQETPLPLSQGICLCLKARHSNDSSLRAHVYPKSISKRLALKLFDYKSMAHLYLTT